MATYYVRPDGNNGNAGTGPAVGQAWATVAYALANAALPDATNTIYIAPGTYRGTVTMSITPSVSNTLVVAGDPTAAQFTGVNAGRVRLTSFPTDNTGTPTLSQTLTCDNKTYFTLRNLHVEGYQTTAVTGIAHFINSKTYTVEKCVFSSYRRGTGSVNVFANTTTTTSINATFDKCIFVGGYASMWIQSPVSGSTFDLTMIVKDCFFMGGAYTSIISAPATGVSVGNGVSFYNNVFFCENTSYIRSSNTTNKTYFYNNAICAFNGIGLDATANTVFEDFNRFSCTTDRSGTMGGGTNSQSGVLGLDFDYSRISGLYPLDFFATYSGSAAENTGTPSGAPTVDIFGNTWSVTNPDVGAATFKLSSATSQYYPTERNASTITIAPGSTSQSIELYLGATGLTASTSGLSARYNRTRTASVGIPLVARTIAQAWTSGGFAEVDATNMPGVYRLDLPDAALAAGADDVTVVVRGASGTNGAVMTVKLSSGGLTSAQTASAVLDAVGSSYVTAGSIGYAIQNSNVASISGSTAAADELEGALLHNGTDYISAQLIAGGGGGAGDVGGNIINLNEDPEVIVQTSAWVGDWHTYVLRLVDSNGTPYDITNDTLAVTYTNIATGSAYAFGGGSATITKQMNGQGIVSILNPAAYATAAVIRLTVSATIGTTVRRFGPLEIEVLAP